jgi:hypothetical protein
LKQQTSVGLWNLELNNTKMEGRMALKEIRISFGFDNTCVIVSHQVKLCSIKKLVNTLDILGIMHTTEYEDRNMVNNGSTPGVVSLKSLLVKLNKFTINYNIRVCTLCGCNYSKCLFIYCCLNIYLRKL